MMDAMPKADHEFIKNIQDYMLDSTNISENDAWDFAFRIWQSKEWLTNFLNDARDENTNILIIQCDTRQKKKHHIAKEQYFEQMGYTMVHSKMLVGDYCIPSRGNIAVDTKADLTELYGNLIQSHDRFHRECVLAQEAGIKLYILVENKNGIKSVADVKGWKNPRYFAYYNAKRQGKVVKPPANNIQLIKIMHSMTRDYGVEFLFCSPSESGKRVLELLKEI